MIGCSLFHLAVPHTILLKEGRRVVRAFFSHSNCVLAEPMQPSFLVQLLPTTGPGLTKNTKDSRICSECLVEPPLLSVGKHWACRLDVDATNDDLSPWKSLSRAPLRWVSFEFAMPPSNFVIVNHLISKFSKYAAQGITTNSWRNTLARP